MAIARKLKPCKTCGDPSYLWAHGNCKNCDGMLRAKAEQQKPIATPSKKPFKAISDKQTKRLAKYRVVRDEFLKERPVCEWDGCDSREVTLHHGAGKIGSLLWNKKYMKSLCWPHHEYCERHPDEAKKLGLSFDRLDRKSVV